MGDVDEKLGRLISKMDEYCADMRRRFVETFSDELESSWREDESDELARLREENERLREALERIDAVDRDAHNLRDAADGLSAAGKIARAALKGSDT